MKSLICGVYKITQINDYNNTKQTHRYRKQTSTYQRAEGRGEGQVRVRGLRDPVIMYNR